MNKRENAYRIVSFVTLLAVAATARPLDALADEKKVEPALGGYCPVSYFRTSMAMKGNPAHQLDYVGQTFYFAGEADKKEFLRTPYKYVPKLGGLCLMALGGPYGNKIPGDPTVFSVIDGRLYLFSSERAKRAYEANPEGVIGRAHNLYERPWIDGYCPVSYQLEGKPVQGTEGFQMEYDRIVYYLSSPAAKAAFEKDAKRYVPQYRTQCATFIARNIRKKADYTLFSVVNGRTFLFSSVKAKQEFDAKPEETIKKADANWATLKDM